MVTSRHCWPVSWQPKGDTGQPGGHQAVVQVLSALLGGGPHRLFSSTILSSSGHRALVGTAINHTTIYQTAFYCTNCWQCECEAEEGRGPLSPSKSPHHSAYLNPATFALLNLGEYEKHSLVEGGGGGTSQLLAFFNSCQVLCNSQSMPGKPPLAQWPRPSKPGDQCLNPFQSASELACFKKIIESGFMKHLPLKWEVSRRYVEGIMDTSTHQLQTVSLNTLPWKDTVLILVPASSNPHLQTDLRSCEITIFECKIDRWSTQERQHQYLQQEGVTLPAPRSTTLTWSTGTYKQLPPGFAFEVKKAN